MPGGRPTKLTPEVRQKICDAVRAGNYLDTAAEFGGVDRSTLHRWLRRGAEASRGVYRELADGVAKAAADAETRKVALIAKAAGEGNWQAAAWWLERRFPERWGRRERVDATVRGGVAPAEASGMDMSKLTDEELKTFEKLYEKILAPSGSASGGDAPPAAGGAGAP